jgi:putative transcriptional regulator
MPTETLGNNIRRLRFERGEMTQHELAERAGVTRQTIISIESGKYAPSLMLAFRIAWVFRQPIENVFFYKPAESPARSSPRSAVTTNRPPSPAARRTAPC